MIRFPEELGYIEAELTMLGSEEGGRQSAIWTGYCPNWYLPGETGREFASACLDLVSGGELSPGNTALVRLYPLAPELWSHAVAGTRLEMTEGPRFRVGEAVVTRVVSAAALAGGA